MSTRADLMPFQFSPLLRARPECTRFREARARNLPGDPAGRCRDFEILCAATCMLIIPLKSCTMPDRAERCAARARDKIVGSRHNTKIVQKETVPMKREEYLLIG